MVANAVRRIALGELTASGRFYADLDELTADGRQAPLAPARRTRAPPAPGRRRRRMPAPAPGAAARGGALHRRVREHGAVRRQHAAVALRGGVRRHPRVGRPGAVVAAGLPRPRRAARARRRARGGEIGARALGFERWRGAVAAEGRCGSSRWSAPAARDERAAEILWQRCSNRRTGASRADPGRRARAAGRRGAPLDTRVVGGRRAARSWARRSARSTASASSRRACAAT